jgi:ribonuclease HII
MVGMRYVIGVDESGTGAWAGPFHVGAVAVEVLPFNQAVGRYLRDSKKLSDAKRRAACPLIREHAAAVAVVEVPVWEIDLGPKTAWRIAISKALMQIKEALGITREAADEHSLLIDGPEDAGLIDLLRSGGWYHPRFEIEGDDKFPAIMAAAILAKTARNDCMVGLSSEFPEYGWDRNAGYGVPAHRAACEKYGVTKHHRRIRRLKRYKGYEPKGNWFDDEGERAND